MSETSTFSAFLENLKGRWYLNALLLGVIVFILSNLVNFLWNGFAYRFISISKVHIFNIEVIFAVALLVLFVSSVYASVGKTHLSLKQQYLLGIKRFMHIIITLLSVQLLTHLGLIMFILPGVVIYGSLQIAVVLAGKRNDVVESLKTSYQYARTYPLYHTIHTFLIIISTAIISTVIYIALQPAIYTFVVYTGSAIGIHILIFVLVLPLLAAYQEAMLRILEQRTS